MGWKDKFPKDNIYFQTSNGILYCGNCLEVMKKFPDECIDLIITSPPYNLGNKHHTGNKYHNPYFDDLPEEEYQNWQVEVLNECYRVLKQTGSMMYNHKNRFKRGVMITPYQWLLKTKFILKQEIVWINRSQNFDKIRFYPFTERVYWLAKSPKTKLYNCLNKYDVFDWKEWKPVGTKGKHTRAFPEKMVQDLISVFPNASLILDPFAGSSIVAVVCERLNKKWICIEVNLEYCELSKQRIKENRNELEE